MSHEYDLISRREAIQRVGLLLGTVTFVGGSGLLTACEQGRTAAAGTSIGKFTADDVAFLDEVAETMLPETTTPGAKAAKVGAFMALMATDTYDASDRQRFRAGMRALDEESRQATGAGFVQATPQQRLALLERLDREQKAYSDAREAARKARTRKDPEKKADAYVPGERQEMAPAPDVGPAPAITADSPAHYFRMMKELALLGYFTSEIGCTVAQRYIESPGRFEPCVPYRAWETSWAAHA